MKVVVTWLTGAPTRERRPESELDYIDYKTHRLDARFSTKFIADSFYDIYEELNNNLYLIDTDDPLPIDSTIDELKDFLESNNDDVYFGTDLVETVTIDGELVFKDDYITSLIKAINKELLHY